MLDKYGVELIGAKLPSIDRAEDRELFKQSMKRIGLSVRVQGRSGTLRQAHAREAHSATSACAAAATRGRER